MQSVEDYLVPTRSGLVYLTQREPIIKSHAWVEDIVVPDTGTISFLSTQSAYRTDSIIRYIGMTSASMLVMASGGDAEPMYFSKMNDDVEMRLAIASRKKQTMKQKTERQNDELNVGEEKEDIIGEIEQEAKTSNGSYVFSELVTFAYECNRTETVMEDAEERYDRLKKLGTDDIGLTFTNAIDMKYKAIGMTRDRIIESLGSDDAVRQEQVKRVIFDVMRGRYIGVIRSKYKSALVYPVTVKGLTWEDSLVKEEISTLTMYERTMGKLDGEGKRSEERIGLLLYDTDKKIIDVINDKAGKRKKKEREDTPLGVGLDALYAIPVSKDGIEALNDVMSEKTRKESEKEVSIQLIKEGRAKKNEEKIRWKMVRYDLFPLKTEIDGEKYFTAVGTRMEVKMIGQIKNVIRQDPEAKICIACHSWQREVYEKLIGAKTITV